MPDLDGPTTQFRELREPIGSPRIALEKIVVVNGSFGGPSSIRQDG